MFSLLFTLLLISQNATHITIDEAVNIALSGNLSIKSSKENILSAKANYREAVSSFLPTLNFSSTYTRFPDQQTQTMQYFDPTTMQITEQEIVLRERGVHETGFTCSLVLWAGGARFANLSANSATVRIKEYENTIVNEQIVYGTIASYLCLIQTEKARKITEEALELAKENYSLTETLFKVGSATSIDQIRAEVQLSQAEGNLISANNAFKNAQSSLCDIMQIEQFNIIPIEPIFKDIELLDLDSTISIAMNSPIINIASEVLNATDAGKKAIVSTFLPTVSLFGNYNWSGNNFEFDEPNYFGGIQFSWTLFQGTQRLHQYSSAQSQLNNAEIQLVEAEHQIVLTVEKEYRDIESAIAQWESFKKTLVAAEKAYNLTDEMYRNGMATSLELFDSQNTYEEAKLGEISAYYSIYISYVNLLSDIGILNKVLLTGELYE